MIIDDYSRGDNITSSDITVIIYNLFQNGKLPMDPNAIYVVLTSPDVKEGTFCEQYCGYHYYFNIGNKAYQYSFVGNTDRCPNSCIASENQEVSPNGDTGVDGMLSVLAHEIVEAMSDPKIDAWLDDKGYENADKW